MKISFSNNSKAVNKVIKKSIKLTKNEQLIEQMQKKIQDAKAARFEAFVNKTAKSMMPNYNTKVQLKVANEDLFTYSKAYRESQTDSIWASWSKLK